MGSWVSSLSSNGQHSLTVPLPHSLPPLAQQGFAELSLLWLSRDCWVWLPPSRHRLLPPTQQGFAEPLLQASFHQLSKGLMSRSYYCIVWLSAVHWVKLYTICTTQGDSVLGWQSFLHKLSKDLLSLPWTYVQSQDSVEWLSHAPTPHSAETQLKKVAESGSPQTAQGPSQRTRLGLAYISQHRDSAEGCSWVWLTHTAQGLSRRM